MSEQRKNESRVVKSALFTHHLTVNLYNIDIYRKNKVVNSVHAFLEKKYFVGCLGE